MKHLILALTTIFCMFAGGSLAQTTFAPPGASWYHDMQYGAFHCFVSGATTIMGKPCSTIEQRALTAEPWKSMGLTISNLIDIKTYTSGDTVFVFNDYYNRFTPLYIFNVNDGDTVCLPHFHPNLFGSSPYDTTFCFRVDSVRMVLYDTAWLKTIYTHSYEYTGWHNDSVISSYGHSQYGAYAQRIGNTTTGIYPECLNCPAVLSESFQLPRHVRCYTDPSMAIKMVPGVCGTPEVSVSDQEAAHQFTAYPLPADALLTVYAPAGTTALLINMDARIATQAVITNGSAVMSTVSLPAGLYVLSILNQEQHSISHKSVTIVH